jgi:site-specific recombinase XerD
LVDLKENFIKHKSHLSTPSIDAYKSVIKLFIEHVGKSMTADLVEPRDIRAFCLQERFSNATKRNYLRHLKSFFNWVVDKEIIDRNPCNDISAPNKKDKLVEKVITEAQLEEVFDAFRSHQHEQRQKGYISDYKQMQFWFKPLITTAFYTGMRRKELINLQWDHVNLEKGEIHVTDTKNGRERTVTVFDPVYYRLKAWHRFNGYPESGLVFPSPQSTNKLEIQLEPNNVSRVFKKYAKKAGLKSSISFHSLRHSNATYRLKEGYDVLVVKEELGHKSIEVTNRYVHLVSNDRKEKAKQRGHITYM